MKMMAHIKGAPISGNHNSDRRLLDGLHKFITTADNSNMAEKIVALRLMDTVMGKQADSYTATDVENYIDEEGGE